MLQTLHEKFSGIVAKIVLGIVVVVFGGFFGTQQFMSSRMETYVANVGSSSLSAPTNEETAVEFPEW